METLDTTGGSSWSPSEPVASDPHALPAESYESAYLEVPEPNLMLQSQELEESAEGEIPQAQSGSDGPFTCCGKTYPRPTEYK